MKSAVSGFGDDRIKPVKKIVEVDHMQSLVRRNFISPIMFGSTLVMYSKVQSNMAVDIYGSLHPGAQYKVMKSWLNGMTIEIPAMPKKDTLIAIIITRLC